MDIGLRIRMLDQVGDDLGIATVPPPIVVGDMVATESAEFRVIAVVVTPSRRSASRRPR
jgi:hypothetical protein